MFQSILVPLDGSSRAEQAIPVAAHIAHVTRGTLILLHVVGTQPDYCTYLAYTPVYTMETELACAKDYLEQVVQRHHLEDILVFKEVFLGIAAQTILAVAKRRHADLIVLCSHGYTGMKRWALGSVAQKIAHLSAVPVLLLHEHDQTSLVASQTSTMRSTRVLVALDGSSFAEAAIAPAVSLVAAFTPAASRGRLHLLSVLKTPPLRETLTYQRYGLDVDLQEEAFAQMSAYLQRVVDTTLHNNRIESNIDITWSVKENSDVADELLKAVESDTKGEVFQAIALATHGRGGFQQWLMGSVAERVLEEAKLPLLIVHPQKEATVAEVAAKEAKAMKLEVGNW